MSLSGDRSHLEPGYRLDRYELLCPIAHGGMASVWLARLHGKHGFEKLVAVKTILPQYASDPRFQQMFLDEARIASGIEHANVAKILDLGESHDVLYLVMEWIDGDSLSKLHRAVRKQQHTMPTGVVLRVMADICAGLHAAHELHDPTGGHLGVVHRDVSPQNILVGVNGAAKLIDFGIAKARDRVSGDTSTGLLKGKIQYMAPEQAVGKSVDRRSDVWAAGAVTYYLLAGAPPYDGANQLATLHLLTSGNPPPPLPAPHPPELDALCQRALAHEPDDRIHTAADLQRAIELLMIEIGCHTTSSDVASFMNEHLGDRTESRRKAVELALQAASERQRVQRLLAAQSGDPPRAPSGTGVPVSSRTDGSGRHSVLTAQDPPRSPSLAPSIPLALSSASASSSFPSKPGLAHGGGAEEAEAQSKVGAAVDDAEAPISQVSSSTLGSAAVVFPRSVRTYARGKQLWAVAIGILGALVFVGVFALASFLLRPPTGRMDSRKTFASGNEPLRPPPSAALTADIPPPPDPLPSPAVSPAPSSDASKETSDTSKPAAPKPSATGSNSASAPRRLDPKPPAPTPSGKTPPKRDYGF